MPVPGIDMDTPAFSVVILSAGLSSRLGAFKPLLPLGAERILERVITLYQSVGIQDIRVVTGHRAEAVAALAASCGTKPVFNPHFLQGMYSSIVAGVADISPDSAGFFIHPVDIPLVRRLTLIDLLNAFNPELADIYYPTFLDDRGHPPLISGRYRDAILSGTGQGGLRELLNRYDDRAMNVPVVDSLILKDIDTPEDYTRAVESLDHYDIPSEAECRAMMLRLAVPQPVIDHCHAVAELTQRMASALNEAGCSLDTDSMVAAARVHDLARNIPHHAAEGARLLREMGFSRIADIVSRHMDFPVDISSPITEAEVVFLADKWIRHDTRVGIQARFDAKLRQYGADPEACREIQKRMQNALTSQHRIESRMGIAIDDL
jgi:CTP:molybdopterin cytidylyltransferase MocA